MSDRLLNATEVAVIIGSSVPTITSWYKWKAIEPDHELAQLLPDYIQVNPRQTRYWKESDIWKLLEFKSRIPQGRNGILGSVTQKYVKKTKEN